MILESIDTLDNGSQATDWLSVADVGFHTSHDDRIVLCSALAKRPGNRLGLNGVTRWCSGHVCFNITSLGKAETSLSVAPLDELFLCLHGRGCNGSRFAVLVQG